MQHPCVQLFAIPWTVAPSSQPAPAPLSQDFPDKSTGFTGDIPNPGIEPWFPGLQADFFFFFNQLRHQGCPCESTYCS